MNLFLDLHVETGLEWPMMWPRKFVGTDDLFLVVLGPFTIYLSGIVHLGDQLCYSDLGIYEYIKFTEHLSS